MTALLMMMQKMGLLHLQEGQIALTVAGQTAALQIIRAHRLWEHYLAQETGFAELDWHDQAEQHEHRLTPAQADTLAAQLNYPSHDPHGDPIPTATGHVVAHGGQPLTAMPLGVPVRIVHLEDEPEVIYAQLVAEDLQLGMIIRITEVTPEFVRFQGNGAEHVLAPIVATNISVKPVKQVIKTDMPQAQQLSDLKPGETAEVLGISSASRGAARRRFLDLGILPGTQITAEFRSPSNDPMAYRIRDALIALRREQADMIQVYKPEVIG
jgi:DtxR family Mn-dependent transcriptional regulator